MPRVLPVPTVVQGQGRLGMRRGLVRAMPGEGETQAKMVTVRKEVTLFQAAGTRVPSQWPWGCWLGPVALAWLVEGTGAVGLWAAGGPWGLGGLGCHPLVLFCSAAAGCRM